MNGHDHKQDMLNLYQQISRPLGDMIVGVSCPRGDVDRATGQSMQGNRGANPNTERMGNEMPSDRTVQRGE